MQTYRDLLVWQKGIQLVKATYQLTEKFPKAETFGLVSQMRRAPVSIPANLAEGYSRKHRPEYAQFVRIAYGSGAELETFLVLAKELQFASISEITTVEAVLDEVMRMLNKLNSSLLAKP
ncbi:four helix bundle protein [Candidatus Kaiserbacteria bacterium CG10_big_fil_rev_8_21_14_0_10_59_10]|uniref:Four helix bundle protein n=1 Tax=Candidatus Kaiserbacteria bacterium CG10_big_fil_rev_8_21_14_0_10_59_10 TaxID=1974612 RepID=A0A2H0U9D4_9BACT|nr:MAG: four helix bundle protein [Candidatus Kaiserbacteria bacterium CG10_big_fil_rev_8_21_14_0_10_59_10]